MPAESRGLLLVVDDTAASRYATSRVLRHAGYEVLEASSGSQAIEVASNAAVDLIVLDIQMPDMNGFEVCRRIREMPSTTRVRVVYLSASFIDAEHKVHGFEAGADGFLTHPVEPAVLNATVGALLRTHAVEVQLQQMVELERVARDEAERANRAKDDFLATLSHELRSPIAAIVGWAEVARHQAAERPDILKSLNAITRNARMQVQLISDLLDVSRITSGNMRSEMKIIPLADVINTSVESVISTARERNVAVDLDVGSHATLVHADAGQLQQIIINLLNNAVKFSNSGGHVTVTLGVHEGSATIRIADDGMGIPPEMLSRIFERFWQQDTSSRRKHGGLGLGLSIVKHLVALHGGSIEATSEGEGKGAQFTVSLPIVSVEHADVVGERESISVDPNHLSDLAGLRVLVVDDDADSRAWVRQVLAAAGAETSESATVEHALVEIELFAPKVIVTDLAMPGRDGFDLIRHLRSTQKIETLSAVALSAYASMDDKQRATEAGFNHFLTKPPEPRELVRLVWQAGRDKVHRANASLSQDNSGNPVDTTPLI